MEKWWVYYNDNPEELGGTGLESFDDAELALAFITKRINEAPQRRSLCDYTMIRGEYTELMITERISKLEIVY